MTKSYIKEAEQNVIAQAKFWNDFQEFIRSTESGVNAITERWSPGKEKFAQAFDLLRQAAYMEQQHALARCFAIGGVGGDHAQQFSREQAKKVFGEDRSVIEWLDTWNRVPSYWLVSDETELKAELKEAMK